MLLVCFGVGRRDSARRHGAIARFAVAVWIHVRSLSRHRPKGEHPASVMCPAAVTPDHEAQRRVNPAETWHPFWNAHRGGDSPRARYMWHVSPYSYGRRARQLQHQPAGAPRWSSCPSVVRPARTVASRATRHGGGHARACAAPAGLRANYGFEQPHGSVAHRMAPRLYHAARRF